MQALPVFLDPFVLADLGGGGLNSGPFAQSHPVNSHDKPVKKR